MNIRLYFTTILLLMSVQSANAETITLQDCLRLATTGNNTLKVAAHDEKTAAENIAIARSGFLPRIDFQGGYTLQKDSQAVIFQGKSLETQQADFGFFGLSATQTIYDFGRTAARQKKATLIREATASDYTALEKNVFLQVIETYYGILEAQKGLKAADDEVIQRVEHLRIAKNLFEQGVVTRNDLLQAEVKLADSRQKKLVAANQLENRWLLLNYLTGRPSIFRADIDESTASSPPLSEEGTEAKALSNRPEITAMTKTVAAAQTDIDESRSNFYPELFAKIGVDYVENDKVREQAIYSATFGLRFNIFDGFVTTAKHRQAYETLGRSKDSLISLQEQIRLELRTAINDARVAAERIKTVEAAIRQGEENLRINRDRYQEQVGTATDVIDAQTLLTQIKTDYYRAVFDYQVATARVRKAMGEL